MCHVPAGTTRYWGDDTVISLVVALSVLLHGLTASPFAQRYAAWFAAMDTEHPDMTVAMVVPETRMRGERD